MIAARDRDTHTTKPTKVGIPPMLSNSSQMLTYTKLWSPIGYMDNAISQDCRGAGGTEMCLLCSNKEGRGAGSILRKGGSSQERTPGPCELYGG